jgi:hypothetical protein
MTDQRMDTEDLNTLAAMIQLGTDYISEQDETDDAANIPKMQSALEILTGLVPVEVAETEPAEPADA